MQPTMGGAHYGFFFGGESPERLDTILKQLMPILDKHNIQRSSQPQPIKINGLEEPEYDLRTKQGLESFVQDFDGAKLLDMFFGQKYSLAQSYEEVSTTDSSKMYEYAATIQPEIEKIVDKYRA